MRVISLGDLAARDISHFGSQGFGIASLAPDAHVVLATLAPGGRIGRHPAVVDQCLVVVEGEADVAGEDGIAHVIRPGWAAVWSTGESHETFSATGLRALVLEAEGLAAAFD